MVYPTTVGAFTMGIVPVDSDYRSPGEIFIDTCLVARSGDSLGVVGWECGEVWLWVKVFLQPLELLLGESR